MRCTNCKQEMEGFWCDDGRHPETGTFYNCKCGNQYWEPDGGEIVRLTNVVVNDSGFNKDGQNKKGKWRLYCNHDRCEKYTMVKWGGCYGGVIDKDGDNYDIRNKCWVCEKHQEDKK